MAVGLQHDFEEDAGDAIGAATLESLERMCQSEDAGKGVAAMAPPPKVGMRVYLKRHCSGCDQLLRSALCAANKLDASRNTMLTLTVPCSRAHVVIGPPVHCHADTTLRIMSYSAGKA